MHEKKNTILVVDDEPHIQKMLGILLDVQNYKIVESLTGKQGLRMAASIKPDLVLLDLGLPDMNGKDVIASIRGWSHVPIIVLSVCAVDEEIVHALNMGANDYVTKPFNVEVLLARINSALRSGAVQEHGESELTNGAIRMDLVRHEVFVHNRLVPFTPKEYDVLRFFLIHHGKMLTHKEILKEVWGAAHTEDTTYLRVYIGQIREKIEDDASNPRYITTQPSIGYRMETVPVRVLEDG